MRTTIDLPDSLFRDAKALAARQGTTLKEVVREALEAAMAGAQEQSSRMDCAPIRGRESGAIPVRSNAEIAALLDEEDLGKAR